MPLDRHAKRSYPPNQQPHNPQRWVENWTVLSRTQKHRTERHGAVGSRIPEWAHEHHDQQIHAGIAQLADGRHDPVMGDADPQLISSWVICDRELRDGETIAHRYASRADITADERDIAGRIAAARLALPDVDRVAPGRSVTVNHLALTRS